MTRSKQTRRRKAKGPVQSKGDGNGEEEEEDQDRRVIDYLNGVLSTFSIEDEKGSYASASTSSSSGGDDPSTSSSTSSDRYMETEVIEMQKKGFGGVSKQKRIGVSTGMVSSVIGKDYVRSSPTGQGRRNEFRNWKGDRWSNEEAEQFLCSMLGDECELSMAVVRDVLCHCGYDVEKALDTLLELSASSYNEFKDASSGNYNQKFGRNSRSTGNATARHQPDRMSNSSSDLSEKELQEIPHSSGYNRREYSEVLVSSTKQSLPSPENTDPCLPQQVLESLFNVPKNSKHEPDSMNWRNIVKKMESFGHGLHVRADGTAELQQSIECAKGEEYRVFRKTATQHYDAMKSYYQKASTAYSSGNKGHAAYLSEQGQAHYKIAREADEKASQEIFEARNKGMQNVVTIDLHGQQVKQAMKLLKVHLLMFTSYVPSVHFLRVITGCGAQGVGKGKLKQTVIDLVKKAGLEWNEENRGTLLIKLDRRRDLSFLEFEGESDS